MTTAYTITPGETIDYEIDFAGPSPGPALKVGDSLQASPTVTISGGLQLGTPLVLGNKVKVRVICPDTVASGLRATLRCVVSTVSGEVLVDSIGISVTA